MTKTPHTYADWMEIISELRLRNNDKEVLLAMQQGSIEWQTGVAERFTQKLWDCVHERINIATDKFDADAKHWKGEHDIIQSILNLRRELAYLSQVVNIPSIPEKFREMYNKSMSDIISKQQNSLEESAKKDRSGKMLSIVRNHKLTAF